MPGRFSHSELTFLINSYGPKKRKANASSWTSFARSRNRKRQREAYRNQRRRTEEINNDSFL